MNLLRGLRNRRLDVRELLLIGVALVVLDLLWHTPLMFPLRFLSVLVHECSHAMVGILTGGSVDRIQLSEQGGLTTIRGGNLILFRSGGYLGSVLFGCLCLYLSRFRQQAPAFCMAAGLSIAAMTLLFVSPLNLFGFGYGLAAGSVIAVVGWRFPKAAPYFLKFLGVLVCLAAFMDIQSTLFGGPVARAHSDAGLLEHDLGIPAILWAVGWLVFSSGMFLWFAFLSATVRRTAVVGRITKSSANTPCGIATDGR